jgi:hypothetical protein
MSRPPDPRTGSEQLQGRHRRSTNSTTAAIGTTWRVTVAAILTGLSAYLLTYPIVGVAIGAVIVAGMILMIGPMLVLQAFRADRSVVPLRRSHRPISGNTPTTVAEVES